MLISVSEFIGVDRDVFARTGALDAVLNVDSRFFIDPYLLRTTEAPGLAHSYEKLSKQFSDIGKLLANSKWQGDIFWKQAWRKFPAREIRGLCIGYSKSGTSGSGIGNQLKSMLLDTAKQIIDAGIGDPEIFELIGLFQEGIGPDRISDLVAGVILEDLLEYSQRIFLDFGAKTQSISYGENTFRLPVNPFNHHPIILIPCDILRDLPVAYDWSDLDIIAEHNERLRRKVNAIIGETWKDATRTEKKSILKRMLIEEPELMKDLIHCYNEKPATRYDFENDPAGQIFWYHTSRRYTREYPLELTLPPIPGPEDFFEVVLTICEKFKDLVENNGVYKLLYDMQDGKPRSEETAQLLFFAIADAYCQANNLDLSRESNAGRGPVDFKISRGYRGRVLVETKLSINTRIVHGLEKQLQAYQEAERTQYSVYLIVDVDKTGKIWPRRKKELNQILFEYQEKGQRIPKIVYIDARPKLSASKI